MSDEELKPCPHCGGSAALQVDESKYYKARVVCLFCGCCTPLEHIPAIAVASWNRRPLKKKPVKLLPCPFCGRTPELRFYTGCEDANGEQVCLRKTPQIHCSCGMNFEISDPYEDYDEYEKECVLAWNRRSRYDILGTGEEK